MTDLLDIPPFLKRVGDVDTTDGRKALYFDSRPPRIVMPKIASQKKRRRKSSIQVLGLKHLDYPSHAISRISEEEAVAIIRRGEPYERKRRKVAA